MFDLSSKLDSHIGRSVNALSAFNKLINKLKKANEGLLDIAIKAEDEERKHNLIAEQAKTQVKANEKIMTKVADLIN
jgi:hypothetical protein